MLRNQRTRTLYRLPVGPSAPATARRIAARELAQTSSAQETVEDTGLLLSELVAERMTRPRPELRLMIDIVRGPQARWSVIDHGAPSMPGGLRSTALDAIADAWGVTRAGGQTRTWFELRPA